MSGLGQICLVTVQNVEESCCSLESSKFKLRPPESVSEAAQHVIGGSARDRDEECKAQSFELCDCASCVTSVATSIERPSKGFR